MNNLIKSLIKKIKSIWKKSPINIIIPIISVVALIIGSIAIGFIKSLIIVILLNLIAFIPGFIKKKRKKKNKKKRSKKAIFKKILIVLLILM